MRRVLAAELAVLAELQTIRVVLLVLVRAIVAAMALRALKRDVVAHEYLLSSFVIVKSLLLIYHTWKMLSTYAAHFPSGDTEVLPESIKEPPLRGHQSKWWRHRDLNSGHCGYEPHALAN